MLRSVQVVLAPRGAMRLRATWVVLSLVLGACGSSGPTTREKHARKSPPKGSSAQPAKSASKPAPKGIPAASEAEKDPYCPDPNREEILRTTKVDPRCAALGALASRPCKADADCPSNAGGTELEVCVQGCCLLSCDNPGACLWGQACKGIGAKRGTGEQRFEKGGCMRISAEWPARVEGNQCKLNWPVTERPCEQCNGFVDDPVCAKAGKACVRRTKCDPWGQCVALRCDDDRDCIAGGRCVQGKCKPGK